MIKDHLKNVVFSNNNYNNSHPTIKTGENYLLYVERMVIFC